MRTVLKDLSIIARREGGPIQVLGEDKFAEKVGISLSAVQFLVGTSFEIPPKEEVVRAVQNLELPHGDKHALDLVNEAYNIMARSRPMQQRYFGSSRPVV